MMLKALVLSLAVTYVLAGGNIPTDCGKSSDHIHFKNVVVQFLDKNGKAATTVDFPGTIIIKSGQICFTGNPIDFTGSQLQIDLKKNEGWLGWVDFCPILKTAGVSCSQPLCSLLSKAENGLNICQMIDKAGCYDITKFPVHTVKLPNVPDIIKTLADGTYKISGRLMMKDGKTEIGCLSDQLTAKGD